MMITSYFEYNGKKSNVFGLRVQAGIDISGPESDVTFIEVPGVDGDIAIDNKRLKAVQRGLPCSLYPAGAIEKSIDEIDEWLKKDVGWRPLSFSWEPEYQYSAILSEGIPFDITLKKFSKAVFNFKIMPYKYLKTGLTSQTLTNGQILKNPFQRKSKPIFEIVGTGDMDLTINSKKYSFKGIDTDIKVDSLAQNAVRISVNNKLENDKLYFFPFPELGAGDNKISWTGSGITSVKIMPRWERVV